MNQEFLPKMRVLESSFHSMAVFQEQFEAFFADKVFFCRDFGLACTCTSSSLMVLNKSAKEI